MSVRIEVLLLLVQEINKQFTLTSVTSKSVGDEMSS